MISNLPCTFAGRRRFLGKYGKLRASQNGQHSKNRNQAPFLTQTFARTITADVYSGQAERGSSLVKWFQSHIAHQLSSILFTDRRSILESLPDTLHTLLLTILTHTSSEIGRACVPPIRTAGVLSPFTYFVGIKVNGVDVGEGPE